MSHYHGLWESGDVEAGRIAVRKSREIIASNPTTTPRERSYIEALAAVYLDESKDKGAQAQALEHKMAALQAAYPDDDEAAIFHALTLAITAPKTDRTFANQRRCGDILEPIFARLPRHPGVAHYIIHCYDNPVLAQRGLAAARMYAKIAPESAHAHHMPSHIFTRVGSWDDSIASNIESAKLAAQAEGASIDGEARDQRLHAMDYLAYACLQSGRVKQAKAVVDEMDSLKPVSRLTLTGDYALAAIPARYALELADWQQASALSVRGEAVPWAQAITWMAIGLGSARLGNLDRAADAERSLASIRDAIAKKNNVYWSNQVEVQRLEVASWIAEKKGNPAGAIALMRSAAELEESMDKHAVTPGAMVPAREMLSQLLFLQNHPRESLAQYEAVLQVAPNRFNALYGAAVSAEAAGNLEAASQYLRKLNGIAAGDERPELVTARKKIAAMARNGQLSQTSRDVPAATD